MPGGSGRFGLGISCCLVDTILPMPNPITISLSPNTTSKDVLRAFQVLLTPVTWRNEAVLREAASHISNLLQGRFVALTSSGRQALFDILRAYNIGQGDEVIMQAFTCIAVPEPVLWTGAKPVYADIDADTYNFDVASVRKNITKRTKAIIIQHTFGIPGPIADILRLAREHNLVVIEDCAHAFGGKLGRQPLGTFGDAAIISFGRDKMLSSVFGGAAVFSDRTQLHRAQEFAKRRPYPPAWWIMQQLLHPLIMAAAIPTYFSGIGKALIIAGQRLGLLSKAVTISERRGRRPNHIAWKYSPALGRLLLEQLAAFPANLAHRQSLVERYQARLDRTEATLPEPPRYAKPAWLRFPIQVDKRDSLLVAAREDNMLLGDWYDAPLVPSNCSLEAFEYSPSTCPVAERVSRRVINLPTYPNLSSAQADAVIELIHRHMSF